MLDIFWVELILAFVVGSIWITIATIVAEKFGSKVGGFIGGLPSTVVVSLLFIGLTQSAQFAANSASVIPLVEGIDGIFLVVYVLFARKGFGLAIAIAFVVWSIMAGLVAFADIHDIILSILLYLPLFLLAYYTLEVRLKLASLGKVRIKYTKLRILGRVLFAGAIIAFAVLVSKYAGPVIGGIFAAFPAVFTSTIVITKISSGTEFSRAIAKPLVVSGLITVVIYAILANQLFPVVGIWFGTLGAYLLTMPFAYLTHLFIQKKLK